MIRLSRDAVDRKAGLTLGDLRALVDEAERAGIEPGVHVDAGVGFRGQLQKIGVSG